MEVNVITVPVKIPDFKAMDGVAKTINVKIPEGTTQEDLENRLEASGVIKTKEAIASDQARQVDADAASKAALLQTNEVIDVPNRNRVETAAMGIDPRGADADARLRLSFGNERGDKLQQVKSILSEKYGQDVEVYRNRAKDDRIEFISPETGQPTTFNDIGFSSKDISGNMGEIIVTGGDVVGSVIGA